MPEPQRVTRSLRCLIEALESAGWRHGYALAQETGLKSGTLYPLLIRLHDLELLEKKWAPPETEGRPPRHLYRLNAKGRAFAGRLALTAPVGNLAWSVKK